MPNDPRQPSSPSKGLRRLYFATALVIGISIYNLGIQQTAYLICAAAIPSITLGIISVISQRRWQLPVEPKTSSESMTEPSHSKGTSKLLNEPMEKSNEIQNDPSHAQENETIQQPERRPSTIQADPEVLALIEDNRPAASEGNAKSPVPKRSLRSSAAKRHSNAPLNLNAAEQALDDQITQRILRREGRASGRGSESGNSTPTSVANGSASSTEQGLRQVDGLPYLQKGYVYVPIDEN